MKAENFFGLSASWSPIMTVTSNSKPDPVSIATTTLQNEADVRIQWQAPVDNYSPLTQYQILIATIDGDFIEHTDCDGTDPSITFCDVSIMSLRQAEFNLVQDSIIKVKVRAQNSIGWGAYSQANLIGLKVFVEPGQMLAPTRGDLTTEEQIQTNWITSDDLDTAGGSIVTSYNLQWKINNTASSFVDLVGQDGSLQLLSTHTQIVGVVAGVKYLFKVRAQNTMGWGKFSDEF
jgi:hypothetical protein